MAGLFNDLIPGDDRIGPSAMSFAGSNQGQPELPAHWASSQLMRQRAQGVDPSLIAVSRRASELADFPFVIGDMGGSRDQATQQKLFDEGKTKTLNSNHLGGRAIDLVPIIDGKPNPNATPEQYASMARAMKQAATELGVNINWGGDWRGAWDKPHFELASIAPTDGPQDRPPPFGVPYTRTAALANGTISDAGGRFSDAPGQNFRTAREGISPQMPSPAVPQSRVQATDISAQSRQPAQPIGLFNDLVPQGAGAASAGSSPGSSPEDSTGGRFTDNAGTNFRVAREGMSEAAPAKTSATEAAARGAATGLTANFYDELRGLMEAGGLNPKDPASLTSLLSGAYKYWTGDPEAVKRYEQGAGRERDLTKRAETDQPLASLAGQIGGAIAIPIGAAGGATMGARTLSGARIGAGMGGLAGVGEGTDTGSRAIGGLTGAATGAAVGAVAPVAVEGVVQGLRGAAAPFAPAARMIRGAFDPEAEAARRVTSALQRDTATAGGPAGLTPAEFAGSVNQGGPAAIMDLGGETTRALARSAANTSPEGRAALNSAIDSRFQSQSDRVTGWLNQTFGPSDTGATREALQDAARRANRPAYAKAYREGDQPLWTPELQRLVGSPDVVDAMREAAAKGKSRAITDGLGGFNSSVQISPSGVVEFTKGKNGVPTYPNLQFWDYTKRALDDGANAARRAGRNDEASVLGQLSGTLRGELDNLVPSYQGARAGAAQFFGAGDALQAGEKFLTSNAPINDARRAFAQMSGPERDLFREGFVQSLTQKIEGAGDRRNVLNAIAQSPRAQQQIELAMGPQRAREFETMMRVEGVMDLARGAVQGNSTTARQLTELGLAGGVGAGSALLTGDPKAMMVGALVYGAAKGRNVIDQRVAQRVAEMLTSNDPSVLRKGINIVGRNRNILDSLRAFDTSVARSGAQQAPAASLIQSMSAGRAENDQPQVHGP